MYGRACGGWRPRAVPTTGRTQVLQVPATPFPFLGSVRVHNGPLFFSSLFSLVVWNIQEAEQSDRKDRLRHVLLCPWRDRIYLASSQASIPPISSTLYMQSIPVSATPNGSTVVRDTLIICFSIYHAQYSSANAQLITMLQE